jgi:hypothetical protein
MLIQYHEHHVTLSSPFVNIVDIVDIALLKSCHHVDFNPFSLLLFLYDEIVYLVDITVLILYRIILRCRRCEHNVSKRPMCHIIHLGYIGPYNVFQISVHFTPFCPIRPPGAMISYYPESFQVMFSFFGPVVLEKILKIFSLYKTM